MLISRKFVNASASAAWRLTHETMSNSARAFAAADMYAGRVPFTPTLSEAAAKARTSVASVRAALRREAERSDILAGRVPLIQPRPAPGAEAQLRDLRNTVASFVPPHPVADAETRLAHIVEELGAERVLDLLAKFDAAHAANGANDNAPITERHTLNGGTTLTA
jgi:hypothetical protein